MIGNPRKYLIPLALATVLSSCGDSPQDARGTVAAGANAADPAIVAGGPPVDAARLALHMAIRSPQEIRFYEATAWSPAWDAASAGELSQAVGNRAAHALDHMRFATGDDARGNRADADVAQTRAALRYAAALARGATEPKSVHTIYTLARPDPDLAGGLARALQQRQLTGWLDGLAPQDASYRALAAAYQAGGSVEVAPAPVAPPPLPIGVGMADPRVPATARALVADGYLAEGPEAEGNVLTPAMADALTRRQRDRGEPADGMIHSPVSVPVPPPPSARPADRLPAIAVAMERLRWLRREVPATRIDVNVATARLTYWRDGAIVDSRPVVVGASDTKTPQLGSPIFRLVANPTWTIPQSIIRKDRMAARSAESLARSGMAWKNGRIVQKPGPRNSLGLVKFDMRNGYAIYLHDTPAKGLFGAAERHRSHGCVRVQDALGFATLLAGNEGIGERWASARASGRTTYVSLPREIPVRLLYATVLLDGAGQPVVRADAYGWDAPIAKKLGFAARDRATADTVAADTGP